MLQKYVLSIIEEEKERLYGTGDFGYMQELMYEYIVTRGIYGKESIDFRIEPVEKYHSKRKKMKWGK